MRPVAELLRRLKVGAEWIDPFAGECSPAEITNDIEGRAARYEMDALDFLRLLADNSAVGCLFDPPYSV